jgi:autophagy-related protein 11
MWAGLLEGLEGNMDAIAKVNLASGLVGKGHTRDVSTASVGGVTLAKEKERFLGDYVSREKMLAVRDGCAKVLGNAPLYRMVSSLN